MSGFLNSIGEVFTEMIAWLGEFVSAIFGEAGVLAPLLPFLAMGVAVSILLLGLRVLFGFIWGK